MLCLGCMLNQKIILYVVVILCHRLFLHHYIHNPITYIVKSTFNIVNFFSKYHTIGAALISDLPDFQNMFQNIFIKISELVVNMITQNQELFVICNYLSQISNKYYQVFQNCLTLVSEF